VWLAAKWKAGRRAIPVLGVAVVSAIAVTNPFDLVWSVIKHSDLLAQLCRSWYFLLGITLSAAGLAAQGLDDFLRNVTWPRRTWLAVLAIPLLVVWSARLMWVWWPGGPGFATGWSGAVEPAVMLAVFSFSIFAIASQTGQLKVWVAVALVLAVGVDYKVFGTSIRANAVSGNVDHMFAQAPVPGLDDKLYRKLRETPEYRIGLDSVDPYPQSLRHYGFTTPQGADPLVPAQYKKILAPPGNYYDLLPLDPTNHSLVRLLGVRYFLTTESQPLYPRLLADNAYHLLSPANGYFRVFEFTQAQPPYHWEAPGQHDWVRKTSWSADERIFTVNSEKGGRFILVEQFFPGWQARVDGQLVSIERWHDAFQSINVPPGEHRVNFRFRAHGLRPGAIVSLVSLLGLMLCVRWPRAR
ncbi:MAG: YfhO family protein, partial [Acidobacteriota bacterium]|nr:YfhO family protein [Acidobacteriota bacterium]